ncbi:HD-GYP domain-containing protein [Thermomonas paludicola]|uniref:HD-GYP domain-containing protein n=1 Tax=Thermomonas paludicola TaxID=2884874 RepID=UPI002114EB4C|nr:HD domain-containing phosphohydrolase [Thermomonas paludicola]
MNPATIRPTATRPLREDDLEVGKPLALAIYDRSGALLLQEGFVIENEQQRKTLLDRGSLIPLQLKPEPEQAAAPPPKPPSTIEAMNQLHRDVGMLHRRLLSGTAAGVKQRVAQLTATIEEHLTRDVDATLASMQLQLDPGNHAARQTHAAIICIFATRALGMDTHTARALAGAALTYDIALGPLAMQLNGQSERLSYTQLAQVRAHPEVSLRLLEAAGIDNPIWVDAVLHHHERLDGSGYPHGLRGNAICETTRLLAIIDIYTAMLRPRVYRDALPARMALRSIFLERGKQVDEGLAMMLVKELGVYPPGTLVRLANDEVGIVLRRGEDATHPQVLRVMTEEGFQESERVLRDTSDAEFHIVDSVPHERMPGIALHAAPLWDV